MNLYVVDHWLPFPQSEYGGMGVYIFRSKEQLKRYLLSTVSDYEKQTLPNYAYRISKVVESAKEFELNPTTDYITGVVDTMFT